MRCRSRTGQSVGRAQLASDRGRAKAQRVAEKYQQNRDPIVGVST